MLNQLALVVVCVAGLYFVTLAAVAFFAPALARRFLLGFAAAPALHYLELVLRLVVGSAFVLHAPATRFPAAFAVVGWILVATTVVLLFVPWHWHRRFAERSVPSALRHLPLLAVGSLLLGGLVLLASFGGAV